MADTKLIEDLKAAADRKVSDAYAHLTSLYDSECDNAEYDRAWEVYEEAKDMLIAINLAEIKFG